MGSTKFGLFAATAVGVALAVSCTSSTATLVLRVRPAAEQPSDPTLGLFVDAVVDEDAPDDSLLYLDVAGGTIIRGGGPIELGDAHRATFRIVPIGDEMVLDGTLTDENEVLARASIVVSRSALADAGANDATIDAPRDTSADDATKDVEASADASSDVGAEP